MPPTASSILSSWRSAFAALPSGSGRRTSSLAQTAATERHLTLHTKTNGNGNVEIHVIDDGCGIAPEVRDRLFTHGFTTKETGHGFGLHASALAAQEMGGTLRAHHDEADLGATFIVELPLSREEASIPFAA